LYHYLSRESDSVLDLYSTVVPSEFEGRGLAKILAIAAFKHVEENRLKMRLSCWYLQGLVDRQQKTFGKFKPFVVSS
jgi:predicted GNAT family acetyltransferase